MRKKSQIEMGETVAVLFIFFMIVIFGFLFYIKIQGSQTGRLIDEKTTKEALTVAQSVIFMPELACTSKNVVEDNCFDKLKLRYFYNNSKANLVHYYDRLGFSRINVTQVYPNDTEESWLLYNNTGGRSSNKMYWMPIAIYDPLEPHLGRHYFGYLKVEVFYDT